ncbi:hypothetical protein ACLB2K_070307 [Fragaria x ananassa]
MLMSVMDFVSTSIALTLAVTLAMLLIRHRNERLCEKKTRYHPVAGTALNQLINFPRLHHYMTELACKYTTYRLLHLSRSAVYTVDPANVEYMLKTNFANYGKGLYLHSILSDVLGNGIFAVDGAKWRHQRKALSSEFSSKMLRDFSSAIFKLGAVKLACVIATCDQAIDIQDLLMKSSLDSIVKILLGIELDSLCGTNEEGNRFSNAFDQANETALLRIIDIFWKIKRFLNIGREAALKENSIVIDQFVYNLIKSKIGIIHHLEDKQSLITKRDFVSRLLELNETDPKYLRDMVLSFMVAGKDSLAVTPSWFLYMMCKHLHIQEKIAQEVREVINLKDHSSVDELAASLTDEALKKMQYLHAALAETIRLYPAVPMDAKMCFSDDTWPDGFSIRKGDMVIYQPYAMGRMKFLWGEDAEEFRPERWLDKNGQFQDESPFKFTAFQAGPRICPGQEHAYMYMKIFAAVLLGSYMFKLADEKKVVNYKTMHKLKYSILLSVMDFLSVSLQPLTVSLAAILLAIFMVGLHARRLCEKTQKRKRYHPVAGTVLNQLINFHRLHDYMTELACKHRTYRLLGFFRNEVYTSDPANVEYMLKTNFANYGKGSYHHSILSDIAGDSIFTVDGESWQHQRKLSSYEFSTKIMRDFSLPVFKTNAVKLAKIISEAVNCNQAIEIQDLLTKSSLDSIVRILLGIDLDTTSGKNEEALTETLRLYPAVPVTAKVCFSDDTWPDGFSVKKGDMIAYQPYAMGRMKFLWGDDAEEFRPERWLDENGTFQPESPFKFTAFQAGPRICLGKEFAYREMKIFSAVLLRYYTFKLNENKIGVNYRTMINLYIDGGIYVLASPRLELERS